jgi:hypothetical protein
MNNTFKIANATGGDQKLMRQGRVHAPVRLKTLGC